MEEDAIPFFRKLGERHPVHYHANTQHTDIRQPLAQDCTTISGLHKRLRQHPADLSMPESNSTFGSKPFIPSALGKNDTMGQPRDYALAPAECDEPPREERHAPTPSGPTGLSNNRHRIQRSAITVIPGPYSNTGAILAPSPGGCSSAVASCWFLGGKSYS